jgi:hypothetical protein
MTLQYQHTDTFSFCLYDMVRDRRLCFEAGAYSLSWILRELNSNYNASYTCLFSGIKDKVITADDLIACLKNQGIPIKFKPEDPT